MEHNFISLSEEKEASKLDHLEFAHSPKKHTGEVNTTTTPKDEVKASRDNLEEVEIHKRIGIQEKNPEGAVREDDHITHLKNGTVFDPGKESIAAYTSKDKLSE